MLRDRELVLPCAEADPAFLLSREWLVTNGLGGYASGTIAGVPTRKYHGLFVPNLTVPKGRYLLISRCDEEVTLEDRRSILGGVEFSDTHMESDTHWHLQEFRLDHRIAVWRFDLGGRVLEKSVFMVQNQNTVCVRYRLLAGEPLTLCIRPFVSFRRHDDLPSREIDRPFVLSICQGRHEVQLAHTPLVLRMGLRPRHGVFVAEGRHAADFLYRIERSRGDPHYESAFSPGCFRDTLARDRPLAFVASTQPWEALEFDVGAALAAERRRTRRLLARAREAVGDPFAEQLVMAADQFIVLPGARLEESVLADAAGRELRTVIAGYHWFGDWGRDTMISLEGLTLRTGRWREAGAILRTFANYVQDGLLPNLFPEGERQALYHTVDATLWYFHAISRYLESVDDRSALRELFPVLESIVTHHLQGTRFGIRVDPADGLIMAGTEDLPLTWMDAKLDDWVVTPRRGKPVEIQALWYNALELMADWARGLGQPDDAYREHARRCREAFNRRYWNPASGCLFDVLDGPDGDDAAIRPNQIFAVSLPHAVLAENRWPAVVQTAMRHLLTPYGLRTLSPEHPDYKRSYHGDLRARDAAYHQGTVWPWLLGHFIDAFLRVHGDRRAARRLLSGFEAHLHEAGVGSISEIFDAETPFNAHGCIAQAWSVAEVLRAWIVTNELAH